MKNMQSLSVFLLLVLITPFGVLGATVELTQSKGTPEPRWTSGDSQLEAGSLYELAFQTRGRAGSLVELKVDGLELDTADLEWRKMLMKVVPDWQEHLLLLDLRGKPSATVRFIFETLRGGHLRNIQRPVVKLDDVRLTEIHGGFADVFSDHMVLQRGKPVPIWGWALTPGQSLTVEFAGQRRTTKADRDGNWRVILDPMPASHKPATLTVRSAINNQQSAISNVLVGDVWLCAGQSNMQFGLNWSNGVRQPWFEPYTAPGRIASAYYPEIRIWCAPRQIAAEPMRSYRSLAKARATARRSTEGRWRVCTPRSVLETGPWGGFSAVGYYFGRDIHQTVGVPIGLMQVAQGGTSAEAWTSAKTLARLPDRLTPTPTVADFLKTKPAAFMTPKGTDFDKQSALFNGMLSPILPFAVKGVLWYQGENNAGDVKYACQYGDILKTMIGDWRAGFGQADLPFLIVQLCNHSSPFVGPSAWPALREQQQRVAREDPHCEMVVAIELHNPDDPKDIHPRNKETVGHRLALAARARVYGEKIVYSGPVYRELRIEDDMIRLLFDHVGSGLMALGGPLLGFVVAGEDRVFHTAEAYIDGDTVLVFSEEVKYPVYVRYAFDHFITPQCNLYNKEGLPASPFRTDTWKPGVVHDFSEQKLTVNGAVVVRPEVFGAE